MSQPQQKSIYIKFMLVNLALLLVPIAFLTGYSIINNRSTVDFEIIQKLHTSGREIQAIIKDYKDTLEKRANSINSDEQVVAAVVKESLDSVKGTLAQHFKSDMASTQSIYNSSGKLLISLFRQNGEVGIYLSPKADTIAIKSEYLSEILAKGSHHRIEVAPKLFQFVLIKPIISSQNMTLGYIEQTLDLAADFAFKMRDRLGYEFLFFDAKAEQRISTHEDLSLYPQSFYLDKASNTKLDYFDLAIRGTPYAFLLYPISWGDSVLNMAVGSSKTETLNAFKENTTKLIVVSLVLALIFSILMAVYAKLLLNPLFELLRLLNLQIKNNSFNEIPVKDETEIGALNKKINHLLKSLGSKPPGQ